MPDQIHIRITDEMYGRIQARQKELGLKTLNQTIVTLIALGLEPRVLIQAPEPQRYEPGDWQMQVGS
jgi:hypothetical protein